MSTMPENLKENRRQINRTTPVANVILALVPIILLVLLESGEDSRKNEPNAQVHLRAACIHTKCTCY